MTTPRSKRCLNNLPRIIASAMSVTCISSKHSSAASSAMPVATCGIGSPSTSWRALPMRSCTSAMNSWKWLRCFGAKPHASEEQVHEHRLPAPDVAVDVEAARRRLAGALEEREQPAASRPPIVQTAAPACRAAPPQRVARRRSPARRRRSARASDRWAVAASVSRSLYARNCFKCRSKRNPRDGNVTDVRTRQH